ncbi:MAG: hypothetical protein M3O03_10890 [Pseudomonadota bacterium]|nr:hypothetical protein [Pseudomonadota bacterium]
MVSEYGPERYLYLARTSYAKVWIEGGEVPLNLASAYLSSGRSGTKTPDENLVYNSPVPLERFSPAIHIVGDTKNITMIGNTYNGRALPDVYNVSRYHEDGVVLCLSTKLDKAIQRRLNKEVCVKIFDVAALKAALDKQIGVIGKSGACKYTLDHQRGHFLKSYLDAWQCEYRIFWPVQKPVKVQIPPGIGELADYAALKA